jgi:stage II sporulation protein M
MGQGGVAVRRRLQHMAVEHVQEHFGIYLMVIFTFILGISAGALAVRWLEESQINELNQYFFNFVDYLSDQQAMNQRLIMQRSLLQNGKFVLALWFCGSVFFGFIPVLILMFYRGFTIGFTVGFLAEQNALRGILFALGAIFPQNLVYVPVSILAGASAVTFSLLLFRRRFMRRPVPHHSFFLQYTVFILIIAALLSLGSAVEAVITPVFMKAVIRIL